MDRVYNFSAGPAMLPQAVLEQARDEMLDWQGLGMSVMEIGHRGLDFGELAEQSEANLRELMNIPANYKILFLAGGASIHFSMVPMNLFGQARKADYVDTGIWSRKAIAEAKHFGQVNVVTRLNEDGKIFVPPQSAWQLNDKASYLHYTPNETISGIEFNWVPQRDIPLVADMTSMILSRPVDVNQYGLIYAGAQKNLGQAGINIAIIREDLLQAPMPFTPSLYQYKLQAEHKSFYNTPPTYSWYILGLVLKWMKAQGGLDYFTALNIRKAEKLYACINKYNHFYLNNVRDDYRSRMNIVFNLPEEELTLRFLSEAHALGLANLKGHKLIGGVRASIYNAMPEAGVDKLIQFMEDFVGRYGQ